MANSNGGIVGVDNPVLPGATALTTTFNSTGTFTAQAGTTEVEYLVVAGGGGGGSANGNSGGGGGELVVLEQLQAYLLLEAQVYL
jgi:hypothetical protein